MSRLLFSLTICLVLVPMSAMAKGTKYALLIGVSRYDPDQLDSLQFPDRDMSELAKALIEKCAFRKENVYQMTATEVGVTRNPRHLPTAKNIRRELKGLIGVCDKGDTLLIAFSGHGIQFRNDKENYFCPADTDLGNRKTLINLQKEVYEPLAKDCDARIKLLFVDACRNDPRADSARKAAKKRKELDLEKINTPQRLIVPKGMAAFFSCQPDQVAIEHKPLKHGVFFHFVIEGLRGKAKDVEGNVTLPSLQSYVYSAVKSYVYRHLKRQIQKPELKASTEGVITLVKAGTRPEPPKKTLPKGEIEEEFTWKGAKRKRRVLRLDLGKGVTLDLVRIKKGAFKMGSPESDKEALGDEKPQHTVELTEDFYVGKYEITKAQFARFVDDTGYKTEAASRGEGAYGWDAEKKRFVKDKKFNWKNVGFAQTDNHPVVNVSWNDTDAFCEWLQKKTGKSIQLPTEAQWEYSCRGGVTTKYFSGDDAVSLKGYANVRDATAKAKLGFSSIFEFDDGYAFTSPVGKFLPNGFGLHDMTGNVWEWCSDFHSRKTYTKNKRIDAKGPETGEHRTLRGGAWDYNPTGCRCACRGRGAPATHGGSIGFRVASSLD